MNAAGSQPRSTSKHCIACGRGARCAIQRTGIFNRALRTCGTSPKSYASTKALRAPATQPLSTSSDIDPDPLDDPFAAVVNPSQDKLAGPRDLHIKRNEGI